MSFTQLLESRVAEARAEHITIYGPKDDPPPVGYWALLSDPDGHTLELSFGQEIALAVEQARSPAAHHYEHANINASAARKARHDL